MTLLIVIIVCLGGFVQSAFGFGFALLSMPLLTLLVDVQLARPLVALLALVSAVGIVARNYRDIDFRSAWRLVAASMVGIPLVMWALPRAPKGWVEAALGILLIIFGAFNLTDPKLPHIENENWSYPLGFIAGVLGGAYNTNGPPVVLYGMLRRWSPPVFRATIQGYFLPVTMAVIVGHKLNGALTIPTLMLAAICLPFVAAAVVAGGYVNKRISPDSFKRALNVLLIVLGLMLLGKIVWP